MTNTDYDFLMIKAEEMESRLTYFYAEMLDKLIQLKVSIKTIYEGDKNDV